MKKTLLILMILIGFNSCVEETTDPIDTTDGTDGSALNLISLKILNPVDTLVISNIHKYKIEGRYSDNSVKDLSDSVTIAAITNSITKLEDSSFTTGKSGNTKVKIAYKNIDLEDEFHSYEIESVPIDERFKSMGNCTIEVPIVLINLLPTLDGITHDENSGPSGYWNLYYPPLEETKIKIYNDLIMSRNLVELGTMFRDYGSGKVNPYACIKVVKIFNVYEWELVQLPNNDNTLNYKPLFKKLKMEELMDQTNFKEVWVSFFPKHSYPSIKDAGLEDPATYWDIPESNMASPITGDISNSHRIPDDLPIYKSTYVVYGNNGHRGPDTNLHNRGHQLEVQLSHIDNAESRDFFWHEFAGKSVNGSMAKNGRAGSSHFPPNAERDYEYDKLEYHPSDIKTWKPGGGKFENVNRSTWASINYPNASFKTMGFTNIENDYSDNAHAKWFVFWFQSVPGKDNNIPYVKNGQEHTITNWWDIFFNWEDAVTKNKKLWE